MQRKKELIIFKIIIVLSLLGFLTSLYLVQSHISPATEGSVCDISSSVSCSLVNTREFSELFNVPVAVFGALWFVFLGLLAWKSMKNKKLIPGLFWWNLLGIAFVVYLIAAEFILKALCPFCTVVHVITVVTFGLIFILHRGKKKLVPLKTFKTWIAWIIILNLIPLIAFNVGGGEDVDYSSLTKCVADKGVDMYGSFKCGICAKQRQLLGDSFEHINEIECHPQGENPQTQLCIDKKIDGTPTWILEQNGVEQKRQEGFMSIEELEEFSGCTFEEVVEDAS
ncbi:hypothetical protein HOD05_00720 [Candidatus Woesearchaeota archaeon]|nr:hypothetical protein [Candidatus Woesearchaeota archaeon]MBT4150929.1 hypothetical protein [Candidatus Woesearchaeota archaeon]MBT4247096.1 hypothetical protein [Candidatus Woesearchaeota archaeon]MBT4433719.1 hypothetical protein [Candidatus Woesearchaeota archaeon]